MNNYKHANILDSKLVPLLLWNVSSINPVKLICGLETHLSGLKLENLFVEAVSGKFNPLCDKTNNSLWSCWNSQGLLVHGADLKFQFFSMKGSGDSKPGISRNWPPGLFWPYAAGNGQLCPAQHRIKLTGRSILTVCSRTKLTGSCISSSIHW